MYEVAGRLISFSAKLDRYTAFFKWCPLRGVGKHGEAGQVVPGLQQPGTGGPRPDRQLDVAPWGFQALRRADLGILDPYLRCQGVGDQKSPYLISIDE